MYDLDHFIETYLTVQNVVSVNVPRTLEKNGLSGFVTAFYNGW